MIVDIKSFAKLVPKLLCIAENKPIKNQSAFARRLEVEPNLLDNVIRGDESWMYENYPETKRQREEWHTKNSHLEEAACEEGENNEYRFLTAMAMCSCLLYTSRCV